MTIDDSQEFFEILRSGSEQDVESLVRRIDPWLRRVIRLRLMGRKLRRILDTTDIYHSLVKDFLRQSATANPNATSQGGLAAYLAASVLHKIQSKARKERRNLGSLPEESSLVSGSQSVEDQVEQRDLVLAISDRLGEQPRRLLELRLQGESWPDIAKRLAGDPDALRMRLTREIAKVVEELEQEASRG